MSDYTIDDTMAKIIYELSDREIHNDIRSEIGIANAETVVDEDPVYAWKYWYRIYQRIPLGECWRRTCYAEYNAIRWELKEISAKDDDDNPYYDYSVKIIEKDSRHCVVESCNTGSKRARVTYLLKYKYKVSEGSTHEEVSYSTLTVRATDETCVKKYGRRVMNLTWPQGASDDEMQMIANAALARYKEPMPVLHVTIQGKDDTLATQIFTREISDVISVVCANLGMASTDFFIDKISIRDNAVKIPICTWLLTGQRTEEAIGYFVIDTDFIDGAKLIA